MPRIRPPNWERRRQAGMGFRFGAVHRWGASGGPGMTNGTGLGAGPRSFHTIAAVPKSAGMKLGTPNWDFWHSKIPMS